MPKRTMVVGVVIIIVAIVAVGALFMGNIRNTGSNATNVTKNATVNGTTENRTNASSSNFTSTINEASGPDCAIGGIFNSIGGGKGEHYMSKSEIAHLTFLYGTYCSAGPLNSTESTQYMMGSYISTAFINNISTMWIMYYNGTSLNPTVNISVEEKVYQSPIVQSIYDNVVGGLVQGYGGMTPIDGEVPLTPVLNATIGGMTYTYVNSTGYYNSSTLITTLVGMKGNEIATVDIYGKLVSQTPLASTIAGDLP